MISEKLRQLEALELARQNGTLNLIASENYAWPEVLKTLSSTFSNKYAEGSPGKRFYAGCKYVDELEVYTAELACKLFGAEYANLQPLSGSTANQIAYAALVKPGDTVLAMAMDAGGHLTHGSQASLTAKIYNFVHYGVDAASEQLDYAQLEKLAIKHKPKLILAGASAYPRIIDFARIQQIAASVRAFFMADIAHIAGLIAAGLHPTPVGLADVVTMTTQKGLRGPRGGMILAKSEYATKIQRAVMPGVQGGAHFNSVMAKAVMLEHALKPEFKSYQELVATNAHFFASELKSLGFRLVSGGTDNHLILLDIWQGDLSLQNKTGKQAEEILESIGITANRNMIPRDTLGPLISSGLRFGTYALTTRGITQPQLKLLAKIIAAALLEPDANLSVLLQQVYSIASGLKAI